MKIVAYGPEKSKGQYRMKILLPILFITGAAFVLLTASMFPVVISEDLGWLTTAGIISTLVLSLAAAIFQGVQIEKEKHVYWIDENRQVFRLDSGVRFLEDPASCRSGSLSWQVRDFRTWAESLDQVPRYAPQILEVIRMERVSGGWQVTYGEKHGKKTKKRRIFISPYWIHGQELTKALQMLRTR